MMNEDAGVADARRDGRERMAEYTNRRKVLLAAALGGTLAATASDAVAAPAAAASSDRNLLDRFAVADVIQRERAARDGFQFDEMARYWHPESRVEVSWFRGSGAAFVEASRRNASADRLSLHQLSPSVVTVTGDRAIAETPTQLLGFAEFDGVPVCNIGSTRLLWRARRSAGEWLIAGLHVIYIRDFLVPCTPGQAVEIDLAEAARYRESYRHLSYMLTHGGKRAADDLPGIDRPELVAALRVQEAEWLANG